MHGKSITVSQDPPLTMNNLNHFSKSKFCINQLKCLLTTYYYINYFIFYKKQHKSMEFYENMDLYAKN